MKNKIKVIKYVHEKDFCVKTFKIEKKMNIF